MIYYFSTTAASDWFIYLLIKVSLFTLLPDLFIYLFQWGKSVSIYLFIYCPSGLIYFIYVSPANEASLLFIYLSSAIITDKFIYV